MTELVCTVESNLTKDQAEKICNEVRRDSDDYTLVEIREYYSESDLLKKDIKKKLNKISKVSEKWVREVEKKQVRNMQYN